MSIKPPVASTDDDSQPGCIITFWSRGATDFYMPKGGVKMETVGIFQSSKVPIKLVNP